MAWDEWEQSKGAATQRHAARVQLNEAGTADGDGGLVVRQDDLGAVGHEAFVLHGELATRTTRWKPGAAAGPYE